MANRLADLLSGIPESFNRSVVEPVGNMLSDLSMPSEPVPRDPNYEYSGILPARRNIQTGAVEWNPLYSNLAKSAVDAFTAPGRAYNGQIDTQSLQGIMEAQNVAQLMAEGGIASGALTPANARAGTLGMFGGAGAKTANLEKLGLAQKLKQAGIPDEQIWKQTGWTSGFPDGKWRFEIPDNAASINKPFPTKGQSFGDVIMDYSKNRPGQNVVVGDMLSHNQLQSAYPNSLNTNLRMKPGEGGSYSAGGAVDPANISLGYGNPMSDVQSTTLHELQHAIQQREGFARGGSPGQMEAQIAATKSGLIASAKKVDVNKAMQELASDPVYQGIPQSENLAIARALQKKGYQVSANEIPALLQSQELKGINSEYEAYKRLAGEAEARLTQARMNLTPEQRLAQYPVSQFDVPVEQQIVRYGDGQAMSVSDKLIAQKGAFQGQIDRTKSIDVKGNDLFSQHASMPARAAVEHNINMTVSPLENGQYVLQYSPLWGSSSKEFHIVGNDPNALALAGIDRLTRSDKAISSAQKAKFDNSLLGKLQAEFGDAFSTAKSTQSKSEYLIHNPTGIKIRIADHNLPLGYEQPDVDLRIGQSIEDKLSAIRDAIK